MIDQGTMMMRRWILPTLLLVMLSACQTPSPVVPVAPAPVPTATLVPLASPEQLTAWKFYDPRDPTRQDLIIKDGDSYRLDPTWRVKSIEYVSAFTGMFPDFEQMLITREGDEFKRDEGLRSASSEQVQSFVNSIANLHPIQAPLQGLLYATDSSGSTRIELVGQDGRRLQLFEFYMGGNAPWNILDNGRLYAQYDGQLALPLYQMVDPSYAAQLAKDEKTTQVAFNTRGRPAQINHGFSGLLPIAPMFGYAIKTDTGEIEGNILRLRAWGQMPDKINGLARVTLEESPASNVPCAILASPSEKEDVSFRCKLTTPPFDGVFHYPITIELNAEAGQLFTTTGVLQGNWQHSQSDQIYLPLPSDLQFALEANPIARDLLTDHVAAARYSGLVTFTMPLSAQLEGDVYLLGQLPYSGTLVRYQVETPFKMQDRRLTIWSLTRPTLDQLVREVGQQAITQQVMQTAPGTMWWLSYTEAQLVSNHKIPGCGTVLVRNLPTTTLPLRTFSFGFSGVNFALIDDQLVIVSAGFWPDDDTLARQLRPTVLAKVDQLPYHSIEWSDNRLEIWLPSDIADSDLEAWKELARTLPGLVYPEDGNLIVSNIGLTLNTHNQLEFVDCP